MGVTSACFHVDSGFDLPLGVENVNRICSKLGVDLKIAKIDREDMINFQLAMFRTGMTCLDIPQDHAFVQMVEQYAVDNDKNIYSMVKIYQRKHSRPFLLGKTLWRNNDRYGFY